MYRNFFLKGNIVVIVLVVLCMAVLFTGCKGSDGAAGAAGVDGQDLTSAAKPETCAGCHVSAGATHQAVYNQYTDTSNLDITINNVSSSASGTYFNTTVQFTASGSAYAPTTTNFKSGFDQTTVYAVKYNSATRTFTDSTSFPTASFTSAALDGVYTAPATTLTYAPESSNALVYVYAVTGKLATEGMQLYSDVANKGVEYGDVDTYVSTANVSGCEKCHGTPYMKHGYRAARVTGLPDFAACKVCHYDTRTGGHQGWQLLVDDPAAYAAQNGTPTTAQKTKYAYKASVMNDVHMSHAMEFAYPQSMANCATCHEGKLVSLLTDTNFKVSTCRSCHPVTAADGTDAKRAPALITLMSDTSLSYTHGSEVGNLYADATAPNCGMCHKAGGSAPEFKTIHTGYNSEIYADASGTKYSDAFTVSIDSVSVASNVLTIKFSATESLATALSVTSIKPTVMVGLYGYDTKDFLVGSHGKTIDTSRDLEYVVGTTHPRFTTVSAANGSWEVTADLSAWADKIADGTVKRAEIAVMPELKNADGVVVALNAPSKTFDLVAKAINNTFFSPIVKVANGCNTCHDALATTFHSANRGGNIVVCRLCHTPMSGGSHLEMQSRSIDSYVHAIHSFQPFDIGDIDFTDPVEELHYEHHIESTYPNFTILNCESCHNANTYNVPDQSNSLPGLLSSSDTVTTRTISGVPSYVTGPASRACGSCHRTELINEDEAGGLAAFNEHTKTNGYMLEETGSVLDAVIESIMAIFK